VRLKQVLKGARVEAIGNDFARPALSLYGKTLEDRNALDTRRP
jgi:hypothetical protein